LVICDSGDIHKKSIRQVSLGMGAEHIFWFVTSDVIIWWGIKFLRGNGYFPPTYEDR
jgi:hypothetical protein